MTDSTEGSTPSQKLTDLRKEDLSLDSIEATDDDVETSVDDAQLHLEETRDLEEDERAARVALLEQEREERQQDLKERKKYAGLVFWLILGWIVLLFVLLGFQGIDFQEGQFSLSDSVLIALITGTTANVLGIFAFVMSYLFPKR